MRLWTIHPKYLDSKGLVALWREGLLALNVLKGNTKGYKNHPQLDRFKNTYDPKIFVSNYLWCVYYESVNRKYNFDSSKLFSNYPTITKIYVTNFQVGYEWGLLQYKIENRKGNHQETFNPYLFTVEQAQKLVHPLFIVRPGRIESWEKVK